MKTALALILSLTATPAFADAVAYFEGNLTPQVRVRVVLSNMERMPEDCDGENAYLGQLNVLSQFGESVSTYTGCWLPIEGGKFVAFKTYFDNRWNRHRFPVDKFTPL